MNAKRVKSGSFPRRRNVKLKLVVSNETPQMAPPKRKPLDDDNEDVITMDRLVLAIRNRLALSDNSTNELSKGAGCSPSTVANFIGTPKRTTRNPQLLTIMRLARVANITVGFDGGGRGGKRRGK